MFGFRPRTAVQRRKNKHLTVSAALKTRIIRKASGALSRTRTDYETVYVI